MSAQHTPGPWRLELEEDGAFWLLSDPGVDMTSPATIAKRGTWSHRAKESHANARLIAAAPDLLAALKAVCSHGTREPQQISSDWDAARAAIARAEGGAV